MGIGNLGLTEIIVLAVLVLVFFGPSRLPDIARGLGKAMREFKKGMNEVQREFEEMERRQRESRSEEERARARKEEGPKAGERVRPPEAEGDPDPDDAAGGTDGEAGEESAPAGGDTGEDRDGERTRDGS